MKFVVENLTKCAPRVGALQEIRNYPNYALETPLPMLYTRGGGLPHITHEVFKIICKGPQIIQVPLVSTYQYQEVMEEFHGSIAEFVGLKDCLTCVTVQDPGDLTHSGHHQREMIPLWTRQGKVLLSAQQYMNIVESFKPDMYYFLSDGDTNAKSANKRIAKSVENTKDFFKQCLERHKRSTTLVNSFPMGAIAGGYSKDARKECIELMANNEILKGFLIDGLHNNGPEVEFIPFDEPKTIVEYVIDNLPADKLRVVQGCWNPLVIIKLVQLGVDVFDTSYCNLVTERSSALVFSTDLHCDDNHPYEINLRQRQYVDDFKPIIEGCECLACQKHTKAYIYHLVTVQELLGPLLLTIHNNHHFMKYFEKIRNAIKDGTIAELERVVEKQFRQNQPNLAQHTKDELQTESSN